MRVIPQRSEEPVTSTDLREQSLPISGTKSDYAPLRPLVNWIRKINYQEEAEDSRAVGRREGYRDGDVDDDEDGGETEIADRCTPSPMKTVPGNEGYRGAPRAVGGMEIILNRGCWMVGWLVVMSYYVGAARGKSRIPATLLD